MSTLRFEPIATQLGKHTSPALLFPADLLEAVEREEIMLDMDPAWSPLVREFMSHYAAVIETAHLLLGAPAFDGLSRLYRELDEEYTPRRRRSPVYDSHLVQHVLGGIPRGLAGETPLGVLARLARSDGARARLQALAENLASSHFDLYRVVHAAGREGELVPLRGGEPFTLHATGPFLAEGDRLLGRVVAFGGRHFMADSPYLLEAPEEEWLAYLERAVELQPAAGGANPDDKTQRPGEKAKSAKPQLTSKQAARRRKELKAKAERNTPAERVVRHLRYGSSVRFWLDFVMDAFAGARRGMIRLAGVPDRPETLPQHPDYAGPELEGLSAASLAANFEAPEDELDAFDDNDELDDDELADDDEDELDEFDDDGSDDDVFDDDTADDADEADDGDDQAGAESNRPTSAVSGAEAPAASARTARLRDEGGEPGA